jgi:hypothetical protein
MRVCVSPEKNKDVLLLFFCSGGNTMNLMENAWNDFLLTGRVDAYLQYKAYETDARLHRPTATAGEAHEAENRRHRPEGLQNRG